MNLRVFQLLLAIVILFTTVTANLAQKKLDRIDRERAFSMLSTIKGVVKKDYYDPKFGGIDIDARFLAAEERLRSAETLGQTYAIIAQVLVDMNDSHTRFYPPARAAIIDYGFRMKMYGPRCFVTDVRPKSDAEKKGLRPGDQVLAVNSFMPSRKELWKLIYYYRILSPQPKLSIKVLTPSGEQKQFEIETEVTPQKMVINFYDTLDFNEAVREGARQEERDKHYFKELGNTLIWKMPSFIFPPGDVSGLISRAAGKQNLILDVRGNPGGYVVTLEKLAGYFFEKDTRIADLVGRKKMDPQEAKSAGSKVFKGNVIVLVDHNSASAAEIFARLMQLEERGVVLGDISAGAVMQSRGVGLDVGSENIVSYGLNLTNANVIMSDGKSLEHVGVVPNLIINPTGEDLALSRDPVLAKALELFGNKMTSSDAGKLFPKEKYYVPRSNLSIHLEF